jgi:nicotinate-nucleotide adenylyltransferase
LRLGVFGGTFDPIHMGHLMAGESVRECLGFDEVVFVPAGCPWLKSGQPVTNACHRLAMVRLAVEGNPRFWVSDTEIRRGGRSYSVDTIEELRLSRDGDSLFLIVGLDALTEMHRWRHPKRLLDLAALVVIERPGSEREGRYSLDRIQVGAWEKVHFVDGPVVDVSASDIRQRVADGWSIKYLVPEAVEVYIRDKGLYRSSDTRVSG